MRPVINLESLWFHVYCSTQLSIQISHVYHFRVFLSFLSRLLLHTGKGTGLPQVRHMRYFIIICWLLLRTKIYIIIEMLRFGYFFKDKTCYKFSVMNIRHSWSLTIIHSTDVFVVIQAMIWTFVQYSFVWVEYPLLELT